jgi:MFS family permease
MTPAKSRQVLALRGLVVLPGALVEGTFAVVLPWLIVRASLGSAWLGVLPALLVSAALVGTLVAPKATKRWGSRRVVLAAALVAAVSLGFAAVFWFLGWVALAFALALIAIAVDGMADVIFSARTPVMARLAKLPLLQFTSANWLWGVCGIALGSILAGATLGDGKLDNPWITWLAAGMAVLSLLVAAALAVLMPRDARSSIGMHETVTASKRVIWNQRTVLLIALIAGISFLYGPVDNLLAPAHLASREREASTFGAIMAAGATGLAVGLMLTQSLRANRSGLVLLLGLAGIVAKLILLWWLPSDVVLIVVSFVTAAAIAPLLPLLESAALMAVAATHRTMLLAAAGTAATLADLAGTAVFGTLANAVGTSTALGVAVVLAALGLIVVLPTGKKVLSPKPKQLS